MLLMSLVGNGCRQKFHQHVKRNMIIIMHNDAVISAADRPALDLNYNSQAAEP